MEKLSLDDVEEAYDNMCDNLPYNLVNSRLLYHSSIKLKVHGYYTIIYYSILYIYAIVHNTVLLITCSVYE